MHIDMQRIDTLFKRMIDLKTRANRVIADAQKQHHPFNGLSDANRLFCGFLAHQGKEQLAPAATKLGLNLDENYEKGIEAAVTDYYQGAGQFLGTTSDMVHDGYVDAVEFLVNHAEAIIQRAERVVNGERLQDGSDPNILFRCC